MRGLFMGGRSCRHLYVLWRQRMALAAGRRKVDGKSPGPVLRTGLESGAAGAVLPAIRATARATPAHAAAFTVHLRWGSA
ncbi:hypothetical protein Shyhy02_28180 [Streptomyces hygroscopicus subsp. hygroscopicus]|nr:hypothetical protein Shyhy02_28180 [Streptomyces hygroscopicus subsp. hygroscopicus]